MGRKSYMVIGILWLLFALAGIAFVFLGLLFASKAERIMSLTFLREMIIPGGVFYIFQLGAAITVSRVPTN